jgi:hypothetical protein
MWDEMFSRETATFFEKFLESGSFSVMIKLK